MASSQPTATRMILALRPPRHRRRHLRSILSSPANARMAASTSRPLNTRKAKTSSGSARTATPTRRTATASAAVTGACGKRRGSNASVRGDATTRQSHNTSGTTRSSCSVATATPAPEMDAASASVTGALRRLPRRSRNHTITGHEALGSTETTQSTHSGGSGTGKDSRGISASRSYSHKRVEAPSSAHRETSPIGMSTYFPRCCSISYSKTTCRDGQPGLRLRHPHRHVSIHRRLCLRPWRRADTAHSRLTVTVTGRALLRGTFFFPHRHLRHPRLMRMYISVPVMWRNCRRN